MLLVVKNEGDGKYIFDVHLENAILGSGLSAEFSKALAKA